MFLEFTKPVLHLTSETFLGSEKRRFRKEGMRLSLLLQLHTELLQTFKKGVET